MTRIKHFIDYNNITQAALAGFLGITPASVSKMVNGHTNPSEENMRKILENDRGWVTTMLVHGDKEAKTDYGPEFLITALRKEVGELREQNKELKAEKERLWAMLEKLAAK